MPLVGPGSVTVLLLSQNVVTEILPCRVQGTDTIPSPEPSRAWYWKEASLGHLVFNAAKRM